MSNCLTVEPCHNQPCDGVAEVERLLPKGRLWSLARESEVSAYFKALGHIKTEINQCICQEWNEQNPCKAVRLADYWHAVYCFPKDCFPEEEWPEKFCEWVELMDNPECPLTSVAWYKAVIEFVAPGKGITLEVRQPGLLAGQCHIDNLGCPEQNVFCITAPPECYFWEELAETPEKPQDGDNPDRCYFIPEIECLRYYVLPFASLGYKTDPINPDGTPVIGVPEENEMEKPDYYYNPKRRC